MHHVHYIVQIVILHMDQFLGVDHDIIIFVGKFELRLDIKPIEMSASMQGYIYPHDIWTRLQTACHIKFSK